MELADLEGKQNLETCS